MSESEGINGQFQQNVFPSKQNNSLWNLSLRVFFPWSINTFSTRVDELINNFTPWYATTWLYLINLRRYYNHSSENSKYVFFPLSAGNEVRISSRIGEDSEISGAACVFGTISRTIKKICCLKIYSIVCRYRFLKYS